MLTKMWNSFLNFFKKMSVEHGDLKKKLKLFRIPEFVQYEPRTLQYDSYAGVRTRTKSGIRTTSLWDPRNNN